MMRLRNTGPLTDPYPPQNLPDLEHGLYAMLLQGGLVKHFANYHGKFDRILRDMGLLDPRDSLAKSGIKFSRPRIEKFLTASGPNSNVALELARSAAIWSGNARY
jgi:hypothetical protein